MKEATTSPLFFIPNLDRHPTRLLLVLKSLNKLQAAELFNLKKPSMVGHGDGVAGSLGKVLLDNVDLTFRAN